MKSQRFDRNNIENGFLGGKDVAGTGNKMNHLGLGYRYNRPFGSVAPIEDYDYVVQRTNEKGERIGVFSNDLHKGLGKGRPYEQTAIARDINNVKKRR